VSTGQPFRLWILAVATLVSTSVPPISQDASLDSDAKSPLKSTSVQVALPLHTEGRFILDSSGRRLKLAGVNWYGAEEKDHVVGGLDLADLRFVAHWLKVEGFNSVRLPWSNELYESDPLIADSAVAANPPLKGKHAMQVLDAVIDALAREGLVVVLDNHTSTADWCCFRGDGNELWYRDSYPESAWISDWQGIVRRYLHQPAVVAVDLRNEVRDGATWGGNDPQLDWHAAAERAGNAILSVNPNLLIVVEGVNSATDLRGMASLPVRLEVAHRVVYSPHDYLSDHDGLSRYQQLEAQLDGAWGYVRSSRAARSRPPRR
jgi:endoglucanase